MQLEDLRRILTVDQVGQMTDAADALGVSQPTLSRVVARVEAEVGVRLFERDPKGVRTNPYGDLVVAAAADIVARYDELQERIAGLLDPDSGTVRLAFLDSMATSLVPQLLRGFREASPHAQVVLRQGPNHEILADLETGAAEVAITSPRTAGAYGWLPLERLRLELVVPNGHPLAGRRRAQVRDLVGESLVTVPKGFGFRTLVDSLCASAGVTPQVAFEIGDLVTIEGIVGSGLGVAILPEHIAGASGTSGIPLAAAGAERIVGLTWRTDRPLTPVAERFVTFVRHRDQTA